MFAMRYFEIEGNFFGKKFQNLILTIILSLIVYQLKSLFEELYKFTKRIILNICSYFLYLYNLISCKKPKKVSMDKYLLSDPHHMPSTKASFKPLCQPTPSSSQLPRGPLAKLDNLKKRIQVPLPEESQNNLTFPLLS